MWDPSRREVLAALGMLVVGVPLPAGATVITGELNPFVVVDPDGLVHVVIPSSEMGQGVCTSLAQVVAEELDVGLDQVRVRTGSGDKAYTLAMGPVRMQLTGGSQSVMTWWEPLREAGAAAREQLVKAAAGKWDVDWRACTTASGVVRHPDGHEAPYGELTALASRIRAGSAEPKDPAKYELVGKSVPRNDLVPKVTGAAEFGVDVRLPNMLRACTVACPVFGGKVGKVDDAAARAIPGVVEVLVFDDFVAVVAETWWPAKQGVAALDITWDEGPNAGLDTEKIEQTLLGGLDGDPKGVGRKHGRALQELESAEVVEATYWVPYVDHQPMEPLNCTVDLREDSCDIYVGTQVQTLTTQAAEQITGLKADQITVHTPFLGGGFGRRGNVDFVEQALWIATRVDRPVQLLWTREEGTRHGFYRPGFAARFRGSVDGGRAHAVHGRICGDNILHGYLPRLLWGVGLVEDFPMEGLGHHESPYAFPHVQMDWVYRKLPVPIGFWRSVSHSHNAFFLESFLDELAHAAGADPLRFRLDLLADAPRHAAVLQRAADEAGWGSAPEGRFQGLAVAESFGSICAQVAEVSVDGGELRVHRVTAAVDCGPVINPDLVHAQIMGGALFGLSSALGGRLDLQGGRIVQGNFHDYPLLRMNQAPEVDVHIVDTPGAPVGGIGEVGTPPIAPAVCNAIFAATGQRVRRLPIVLEST